ncbi:energy-coupled thiamine transporter ThiT [Miniphocaeibacter massiliensis]|uniref:energy-coupled thiamine transporter ThiT n=1 Tax=Miniphocaeibacter massiliensis TaxID=2041841 RepID=UPI000C078806|nr:energy-coupled thiamine transporter ThiT [Miniphocaeibacter massiliensis]
MEKKKRFDINIRMLAEAGVMIALSVILNNIKLYKMPQGGSITPGGYVPLLLFALRWGSVPGIIVGAMYGMLDSLIDPYIISLLQFLFDYPLAYAMLGVAGFGKKSIKLEKKGDILKVVISVIFANFMRMAMAILSGIVFFKKFLPVDIPLLYGSFLYNGLYIIPNTIISIILIFLLLPRLKRVNK